jgi:predicted metal-dependent phosphoesterase TrpH
MRLDLHSHSTGSDGTESPTELAARVAQRGLAIFALTDHDAVTPIEVAGTRTIRAVEISCDHAGKTIHLLAYDRGGAAWTELEAKLVATREARRNRLRVMAAKLKARGIVIDVEPMIARADGRSVGRPDLARAMVAQGKATSLKDAFARHLYDNGPVDVPHRALSLRDALALGRAANAAMSLAHPHLYEPSLVRAHVGDGLGGIEAFYGGYDPGERAQWIELADELGLVCTGGADAHGPDDSIGVELPDDRAEKLLEWLA